MTGISASSLGELVRLAVIEHGIFEIRPGNPASGGLIIDAIELIMLLLMLLVTISAFPYDRNRNRMIV